MQPSQPAYIENAVSQQPAISQRKTRILGAALAVCGAAVAWAWSQPARADVPLPRTATTESASPVSEVDEAERLRSRIRQRMQAPRGAQEAPYGTGYEARRRLDADPREDAPRIERMERMERVDRIERVERPVERPVRVERPDIDRGGRGGR
jgi:hypothetical protein